jgi:hypothetical protein
MNDISAAPPDPFARCALLHRSGGFRADRAQRAAGAHLAIRRPCFARWRNPATTSPSRSPARACSASAAATANCAPSTMSASTAPMSWSAAKAMPAARLPLPRLDLRADRRAARRRPTSKSVRASTSREICLTEVRTRTFLGFIFVNLDPDAAPMDDWFPQCAGELADFVPQIGPS